MARPKKNTVDYFPHDCHWSKEIEIFVNKYGNNGYAFYYRLLELIGLTPLHLYDCNELRDWQYLLAKTSVEEDMAVELIEFLVALSIIDKEMWDKKMKEICNKKILIEKEQDDSNYNHDICPITGNRTRITGCIEYPLYNEAYLISVYKLVILKFLFKFKLASKSLALI